MSRNRSVIVVTSMDAGSGRETVLGFHAAAVEYGWITDVVESDRPLETLLPRWNPDAIVVGSRGYYKIPAPLRWERVLVGAGLEPSAPNVSRVIMDDEAAGRIAADHFIDNGLQAVAAITYAWPGFAKRRIAALEARAAERGVRYFGAFDQLEAARRVPMEQMWEPAAAWLRTAPKPLGLFCGCDRWGRLVAHGCRLTGLRVPEEVALLGVDDDEIECELTWPPLSSVALPWEQMGRIAAQLLERRFNGEEALKEPIVLQPTEVVVRRSSDILAVADAEVSQALDFIRRNATRGPVRVADILKQVPTHRAKLHRAFRSELGRTIMDEVRRVRVEHAKRLLSSSAMTVDQIASRSGFANYRKLTAAFKQEVGATPGAYRKKFKS